MQSPSTHTIPTSTPNGRKSAKTWLAKKREPAANSNLLYSRTPFSFSRTHGQEKLKALVANWENGVKDAFDALFHSEVVSLGPIAAIAETFTKAGDALERELEVHEQVRADEDN